MIPTMTSSDSAVSSYTNNVHVYQGQTDDSSLLSIVKKSVSAVIKRLRVFTLNTSMAALS